MTEAGGLQPWWWKCIKLGNFGSLLNLFFISLGSKIRSSQKPNQVKLALINRAKTTIKGESNLLKCLLPFAKKNILTYNCRMFFCWERKKVLKFLLQDISDIERIRENIQVCKLQWHAAVSLQMESHKIWWKARSGLEG